jgi:hypothetical protein
LWIVIQVIGSLQTQCFGFKTNTVLKCITKNSSKP